MKNILLVCNAGMSTSMLVQKMQAAAKEQGIEATIQAKSVTEQMFYYLDHRLGIRNLKWKNLQMEEFQWK